MLKKLNTLIAIQALCLALTAFTMVTLSPSAKAESMEGMGDLYPGASYDLSELYSKDSLQNATDLGVMCRHIVTVETVLVKGEDGIVFEEIKSTLTENSECQNLTEHPLLPELIKLGLKVDYAVQDDLSFRIFKVTYPAGTELAKCKVTLIVGTLFMPVSEKQVDETVLFVHSKDRYCTLSI